MNNQKFFFGCNALAEFQRYLHILNTNKVFIVRGKNSYVSCGAKTAIDEILTVEGIEAVEWYDFEENPKIEDVSRGLQLLQSSDATVIIACGGGSVIDMAKLVRFRYSYNGDLTEGNFIKRRDVLPLFAVPTTSGTGCEATPFAVCYKDNIKYSVEHEDILPDCAVVYPPFTYGNPAYLAACTGFDALAQAIEAYWSVNATPQSDQYAEDAMYMLWNNLPMAVNSPTELVRGRMAEAAYFAGKAIAITKTTAPHAFSYAFTTYCGIPHGHAVSLTFPYFFSLNILEKEECALRDGIVREVYATKMQNLRKLLGLKESCDSQAYLKEYISTIGLKTLDCTNVDISHLLSLVNVNRLQNNPVTVTDRIICELETFMVNSNCY